MLTGGWEANLLFPKIGISWIYPPRTQDAGSWQRFRSFEFSPNLLNMSSGYPGDKNLWWGGGSSHRDGT